VSKKGRAGSGRRPDGDRGADRGSRRATRPVRRRPGSSPWRPLLLAGAGLAIVATLAFVLLSQGSAPPTGPAAFRSPSAIAAIPSPSRVSPGTSGPASTVNPAATGFPSIAGVSCDPFEQVTYHVHAHLNIRVDGVLQAIPPDVGQRSTCLYWLHTHQPHGVIHVEAPAETAFTLGQFFDVWGKPLDATHVGDAVVPAGSKLWLFVDRKPIKGDLRAIPLTNLAAIEIQIGPAALEPLPYTFPADFG
jgi:hypothetical protein